MGLCKCPKKVVTTLFCYEHRVNVCESCLVSNHPSCIIQSYYKWLQDSEYDPKCQLCSEDLALQECVRLTCFHVFHWKCFTNVFDDYPQTTAPAGYNCPTCSSTIFPSPHLVSPVADELRKKLSTLGWCGIADNSDSTVEEIRHPRDFVKSKLKLVEEARRLQSEPLCHMEPVPTRNKRTSLDFDSMFKQQGYYKLTPPTTLYTIEEDTRKYRRRRPMTLRQSLNHLRRSPYCKLIFLICCTLFVLGALFVTVIPTEFEDEKAFNRIIALKQRADQSRLEMEVFDEQ